MKNYKELDELERYLKEHNYEYVRVRRWSTALELVYKQCGLNWDGGEQIIVFENGERVWDSICGKYSYGFEKGLLEVMGEPVVRDSDGDSVCGYLTAQDIIDRLENKE